ncbi:MAG: UDP-N-acetylmuramate--L-alanine ligase [Eubacteriaceae bacterium]|nr:UDP-N-acetylmuramate--L-alanine ligase [Eubacteriaceae bacterium]
MIDLSKVKNIHCIGIGGIGLSAVADILISKGYKVSGSDMNKNEKVEHLIGEGVNVFIGHDASNIEDVDLVVYSNAIGKDNPELNAAREKGIPCITRAMMLGQLMTEHKHSIAVAGTHGKTTTTSMISLIIKHADMDPTILVGGNLNEIHGNVSVGHGDFFITEACEYMDSFLQFRPMIEIILNIDSDHLDYFKDIEHIVESFNDFANLVPDDGMIFAYDANPFVKKVIKGRKNVITYGLSENSDFYAEDIEFNGAGHPAFSCYHKGKEICRVQLDVPGEHNILNALVSIACTYTLGIDTKVIVDTLESYSGTERRFDIIGETSNGMKVIDDYAHHPTEIKATLKAALNLPHNNIWCIFQPHTYTRTIALFDEFVNAFGDADKVVFAKIYPAREKNIYKISSKELMNEFKKKHPGREVYYFEDFEDIARFAYDNAEKGDLILTIGAGDVYKIGEMILDLDKKTQENK